MSINKLIMLAAAFILASLIASTPAAAQTPCNPLDPAADCDGDGIANGVDTCNNLDNLNPLLDCDGDGIPNTADNCPYTDTAEDLLVGACTISGLASTILTEGQDAGCSLTELLGDGLDNCELIANGKNHGKYVSCVARLTNSYKKKKYLTGAEKGYIQSCAAQSDIGKKTK